MIVCQLCDILSENFSLYIKELRAQSTDFQKLSYYFSRYFVAFGKIAVTLHTGFG